MTQRRSSYSVLWENPPGPKSGVWLTRVIGSRSYRTYIAPNGLLSIQECAAVLGVSRMTVHRWVRDKKHKAVLHRGVAMVQLREIKRLVAAREGPRPPTIYIVEEGRRLHAKIDKH
jgi:hypothetical protein